MNSAIATLLVVDLNVAQVDSSFLEFPTWVWFALSIIASILLYLWFDRRNKRRALTAPTQIPLQPPPGSGQLDQQFTRSAARKFQPSSTENKTFKDVAGCEEGIKKLKRVQRWLKAPGWFSHFGARLPKGVLLVGPPGTGKTLLAKALAGEAGAVFFSISGSQFVEMYVGVGAARVRDLFQEARNEVIRTGGPVIIFIDEIDAVGKQRGTGAQSHDEREQTLNQILVEMDGFAPNQGILVLAATNRVDVLDPALKRPGRFDYQVLVDLPDLAGREAIFRVHTRNKPLADTIDMKLLASRTPGFSGADIEAVANEAATIAAERVEKELSLLQRAESGDLPANNIVRAITLEEFDEAVDVVQMGDARVARAHAMSKADMLQTAYHEVGHAAVVTARGGDPVTKITIVPRARALGYMQALPEGDRFNMTEEQLKTRIMMAMGGRVAQEIFLKTVDTGAENDFKQGTAIAQRMVAQFGMSKLGPIHVDLNAAQLGSPMYGPDLLNKMCAEWMRILNDSRKEAQRIIEANREAIERVVAVLMVKETILGPEFRQLWNDKPTVISAENDEAAESATTVGDGAPTL